jgi:outer membrane immunogenic protein
MKRLLLVSASLLGLATAPVIAADAPPDQTRQIIYAPPTPAPQYNWAPPLPAAAPVYNWSACYIGGNLGGVWSSKTFSDPTGAATGVAGASLGSHSPTGGGGGGQVGCDYQVGWAVFGVQGMYDLVSANSNNTWPSLSFVNTTNVHWFSTLTGRIGFVPMPRWLVYAKGGGAWVGEDHSIQGPLGNTTLFNASTTRSGWTAGVGVEWGFAANWSVFAEYNYADFGTSTVRFTPLTAFGPVTTFGVASGLPINIQQNVNLFLVGLNVRFGPGPWTLNY